MESTKKAIVFVLESYPIDSQAFITNQIIGLIKKDFKVTISVLKINPIKGSSQEKLIDKYNLRNHFHLRALKQQQSIVSRLVSVLLLFLKNLDLYKCFFKIFFSNQKNKIRTWQKIINFKPLLKQNLFHVHFAENGFFLMTFKKLGLLKADSKIITTFHGYDAHYTEDSFNQKSQELADVFKFSSNIIVNSEYLKQQIIRLKCPKEKISIISVSYNSDLFKSQNRLKNQKTIKILSVGRLVEFKGHIYGLKVVESLLELGYNVDYKIIGDGQERLFLLDYIKNNNLLNSITLLGAKTQEQIKAQMLESDIFLMCSTADATGRCETFGLVSVEAQATGLPVVAFDSGGVSETFLNNKTGILVPDKDLEKMRESIIKLIKNEALRLEMGNRAAEFTNKMFGLEQITNKHIMLYNHDNK
jgi:colanic acid/amylovoran biosynthesis glycosyltransferase